MAASSPSPAAAFGASAPGGWLYGPVVDIAIGTGVGYFVSIPLLFLLSRMLGLSDWPVVAGALFGIFVSGPHYGATILRVYEQRDDRRRYAIFAVWMTAALCGLFVLGLNVALIGSLLFTIYVTWSPWHYAGQNYGIAVMFLRRRGVEIDPRVRQLLYSSFILSFALTFLVLNSVNPVSYASISISGESAFTFLSLGLPAGFQRVAVIVTALAYVLSLGGAASLLLRSARVRDLWPAGCLVLTQALWFAIPAACLAIADFPLSGLAFTTVWIAVAHAMQYLWVTSYFARRADPSLRLGPYLSRALLAGTTVNVLPGLIFAPALLGTVPWDAGLAVLLISVVNLHHFILDGAIWKLRDGRIARLLLRDATPEADSLAAPESRVSWFRPVVGVFGVASLAVAGLNLWERDFGVNRAASDLDRLQTASTRLGWIGRDPPSLHAHIAGVYLQQDQPDAAMAEFRRSLDLYPTATAWVGVGELHAKQGDWETASRAFLSALELDPDSVPALINLSNAWGQLGQPERALPVLERVQMLVPDNPAIQNAIAALREGA